MRTHLEGLLMPVDLAFLLRTLTCLVVWHSVGSPWCPSDVERPVHLREVRAVGSGLTGTVWTTSCIKVVSSSLRVGISYTLWLSLKYWSYRRENLEPPKPVIENLLGLAVKLLGIFFMVVKRLCKPCLKASLFTKHLHINSYETA